MNKRVLEKNKSLELKKHVGAIHSSNKLTLVQRKIANGLLYNAYLTLLTQNEHQIHIESLCKLIGYDSKDYKIIKEALVALISTVIEWNLVDSTQHNKCDVWNASSIIADAKIDGPICTYSYSNAMRRLLYRPEIYGRLNLQVQAKFKSTYGLALYENCIRYRNLKQTPWFDITTFRKLMGVEEGKYAIFRDLKRRVIEKAVSEVNLFSPITITAKLRKELRQVTAIQFEIKAKQEEVTQDNVINNEKHNLVLRLKKDFGFSKSLVDETLQLYDEKYILEKISIVESSNSFQTGKIVNLAKYLQGALKKDYQQAKSSLSRVEQIHSETQQQETERLAKEELIQQYRSYQNNVILESYSALEKNKRKLIDARFEEQIQKSLYLDVFRREGLENMLVLEKFCNFARKHAAELLEKSMSFAEFCDEQNGE